jgi:uncharacterized membrane protein (DUF2068 family)
MEEEKIVRPPSYVVLIFYKFAAGALEVLTATLFLLFGRQFSNFYQNFELAHVDQEPSLYVRTVEHAVPFLLDHKMYIIVFLLTFGLGKIIGSIGLWYEKMWAIHMMIVLSMLLIPFELVDFISHPSGFKLFYILMNIIIVVYLLRFNPHVQHVMRKHHQAKEKRLAKAN